MDLITTAETTEAHAATAELREVSKAAQARGNRWIKATPEEQARELAAKRRYHSARRNYAKAYGKALNLPG